MDKKIIENKALNKQYTDCEHSSGLKIFIYNMPGFSSYYALFGTRYGSIDNEFIGSDGNKVTVPEGIAHFLEHKLFESEEGDAFTRFSATGAYANAYTSFDRTCYLFSCSKRFYENLDILLDFVRSPYFTPETVQKEQGIIGQEIKMYEDLPGWRVMFNMLTAMYHSHPVKIDIPGTTDSIAQITDKLLYECYNKFYSLSNMFLCIAGDVDTDEVLKRVDETIKEQRNEPPLRVAVEEPDTVVDGYTEAKLPVSIPLFCFGYKDSASEPVKSAKEIVCTEILQKILVGSASPLYKSLIEDSLINEEFGCEYFVGSGYAVIMFEGESKHPKEVANRIKAEVERLKNDGIEEGLFEAVRRGIYGASLKQFGNSNSVGSLLVDCAMRNENLFLQFDVLKSITVNDIYERLSVFHDDRSVLSVINPKE